MKTVLLVMCLVVLIPGFCLAGDDRDENVRDMFVFHFVQTLELLSVEVTPEQKDALYEIHPLLMAYADAPIRHPNSFWGTVRHHERSEVDIKHARELILRGKIKGIVWLHERTQLDGFDGRRYIARGNTDPLRAAVDSVDPTGVFITEETE